MLNQASGDRQILAKQLNISPYQLSYVTNSGEGEGLLFYGNIIIPFKDRFNKNLKLYSLMTTKPEEVEKRKEEEAKEEAKAAQEEEAIRAFRRSIEDWHPEDKEAETAPDPAEKKEIPSLKLPEAFGTKPAAPAETVKPRRPRKPFVWTPGELEDEEYWLDADLPEEPVDEDDPGKRFILPDDDDEDEKT